MIVTFNGREVPLEDCRISAMPFNRVWTGVPPVSIRQRGNVNTVKVE